MKTSSRSVPPSPTGTSIRTQTFRAGFLLVGVALAQLGIGASGCARTTSCEVNGQVYAEGDSFPASDGCNTCTCGEGGLVACTEIACVASCGGLLGLACADDQFCNYPPDALCGAADATGVCEPLPDACDTVLAPVCGCDDQTYGNACEANRAGVSVVSEGECGAPPGSGSETLEVGESCGGDQMAGAPTCAPGLFCEYAPEAICGAADAQGTCAVIPEVCTQVFAPVCGCDGETYGNACTAASSGVSVASQGECGDIPPDGANGGGAGAPGTPECKRDRDCPIPSCACLDENGDGVCENQCPVIGCRDGQCVVVSPPASDATPQVGDSCGGFVLAGSPGCGAGLFCQYQAGALCGAADAPGECVAIPTSCPAGGDPVCGCDGMTYESSCHAALVEASILDNGACN